MSKKMSLGKKLFCIIVVLLVIWLIWKFLSNFLSIKKEGYFAALGKKEPFAALGQKKEPFAALGQKKEPFAPLAKV